MRFWDASAVVPLLVEEATTSTMVRGLGNDQEMVVWWGTEVECMSAIARRRRSNSLTQGLERDAIDRLRHLSRSWKEIDPASAVRETAIRLLQTYDLRAADALQLAAAFAAAEGRPSTLAFVSLDARLNEAALREGFRLLDLAT